jgi:hypothetical protein
MDHDSKLDASAEYLVTIPKHYGRYPHSTQTNSHVAVHSTHVVIECSVVQNSHNPWPASRDASLSALVGRSLRAFAELLYAQIRLLPVPSPTTKAEKNLFARINSSTGMLPPPPSRDDDAPQYILDALHMIVKERSLAIDEIQAGPQIAKRLIGVRGASSKNKTEINKTRGKDGTKEPMTKHGIHESTREWRHERKTKERK